MMLGQLATNLDYKVRPQILTAPTIHKNYLKLCRSKYKTQIIKLLKENIGENQLSSDRQGFPKHDTLLRNHFLNDTSDSIKIALITNTYALNKSNHLYKTETTEDARETETHL